MAQSDDAAAALRGLGVDAIAVDEMRDADKSTDRVFRVFIDYDASMPGILLDAVKAMTAGGEMTSGAWGVRSYAAPSIPGCGRMMTIEATLLKA